MFDAKRFLDQFVNSGAAGGLAGGVAGGALVNALAGKKGRKLAGSALKVGGLALVGGLAYTAWRKYQQGAAPPSGRGVQAPPAQDAFFPKPEDAASAQALSLLLVRSMIAAAKADGHIDLQEHQAIIARINTLDLGAEEKAFLFDEFTRPQDIDALAAAVDTPEHAAEVYAASALVLDPPAPPERLYLDRLARALHLPSSLVDEIHGAMDSQQAAA